MRWLDDALFAPEARAAYFRLLDQGWTDALRTPEKEVKGRWSRAISHGTCP
jgi:exodeoxyribonuclease-3